MPMILSNIIFTFCAIIYLHYITGALLQIGVANTVVFDLYFYADCVKGDEISRI
jgi:hypothetical protein